MSWRVVLSRQSVRDARKLRQAGLQPRAEKLLELLKQDPSRTPRASSNWWERLSGYFSRRINIRRRIICRVDQGLRMVYAFRMWTRHE